MDTAQKSSTVDELEERIKEQDGVAAEIMRLASTAGLRVIVWTANDAEQAVKEACRRLGVQESSVDIRSAAFDVMESVRFLEDLSIERGWEILNEEAEEVVEDLCHEEEPEDED